MEYIKFQFKLSNPMPRKPPGVPAFAVWGFEVEYNGPTRNVNGAFLSNGDISKDLPLVGTRFGVCLAPATKFNLDKVEILEKAGQVKVFGKKKIEVDESTEDETLTVVDVAEIEKAAEAEAEEAVVLPKPKGRVRRE